MLIALFIHSILLFFEILLCYQVKSAMQAITTQPTHISSIEHEPNCTHENTFVDPQVQKARLKSLVDLDI